MHHHHRKNYLPVFWIQYVNNVSLKNIIFKNKQKFVNYDSRLQLKNGDRVTLIASVDMFVLLFIYYFRGGS